MTQFERYRALTDKQIGGLFRVPLTATQHSYAQFLGDRTFAFYDYLTTNPTPDYVAVTEQPVLFRIVVMGLVFKLRGAAKWQGVGHYPIPTTLSEPAVFCRRNVSGRDAITGELQYKFYRVVHVPDEELLPITCLECEALELSMVWNPINIIERLQHHYRLSPTS